MPSFDFNNKKPSSSKKKNNEDTRSSRKTVYAPDSRVWGLIEPFRVAQSEMDFKDILDYPFRSERERIKYNTRKYKDMSVVDMFNEAFHKNIQETYARMEVPSEVEVGSRIYLKIQSITKKGGVVFDSGAYKENFVTRNPLAKYSKFQDYLPVKPVPVRVLESDSRKVVVDLYSPMIEDFLTPRSKNPWIQNCLDIHQVHPITVKNLHLVRGGYLGQAVIPNLSDFLGEDFTVDCFVPGSQIVQNTTDDFTQFEGQDVQAFVTSWNPMGLNGRPGAALVCSAKAYIKHLGNLKLRELFNAWCDQDEKWKEISNQKLDLKITGVLHSAKKCGVFLESDLGFTGMMKASPDELVNYKSGEHLECRLAGFDEDLYFNEAAGQYQHKTPFEIQDGCIRRVNVKPVFELYVEPQA